MSIHTTTNINSEGWSPNVQAFPVKEIAPELLVLNTSTVTRTNLGDEQAVLIPTLSNVDADIVLEGDEIPEEDPTFDETRVFTRRVSNLTILSAELASQTGVGNTLADSMKNAVVSKMNRQYLHGTSPDGLMTLATDGGVLGANLDVLSDATWAVAAAAGSADWLVMAPSAAATLSKLKVGDGSNQALVQDLSDLYNLKVMVSNDMAADTLLVGSNRAVYSAVSPIDIAISDHYRFANNARAYRVNLRAGWALANTAGVVKISTATE